MKKYEKTNIAALLRSKSTVFTFKEILLASGENDPQLLVRRLSYYVSKGQLYHIRRGLYAKDKNYNRFELATKIYTPAYISLETVLAQAGVIFQFYEKIFVVTYKTKDLECDSYTYSFRTIKSDILTSREGIENNETYSIATKERAFLDTLYLNKDYHFDNLAPLDFHKIQTLLPLYNNKRMAKAVNNYYQDYQRTLL